MLANYHALATNAIDNFQEGKMVIQQIKSRRVTRYFDLNKVKKQYIDDLEEDEEMISNGSDAEQRSEVEPVATNKGRTAENEINERDHSQLRGNDEDHHTGDDDGDGGDGLEGRRTFAVDPSILADVEELEFLDAEDAVRELSSHHYWTLKSKLRVQLPNFCLRPLLNTTLFAAHFSTCPASSDSTERAGSPGWCGPGSHLYSL
eukprot:s295_g17.t1